VRALTTAWTSQGAKPSIEQDNYINQFDPKMKKNFSYAETFHKLKDVYNLEAYSSEELQ
jgi:hypothetical protein